MDNAIRDIVAKNVKEYRKNAHMTQAQLAAQIDKTVEMVCQLETGVASTKLVTLERIAHVLGIEPYQLLLPKKYPNFDRFPSDLNDLLVILEQQNPSFLSSLKTMLEQVIIVTKKDTNDKNDETDANKKQRKEKKKA